MIVSNFELLIKRIATVPSSTPDSIASVFRRVVQAYFLAITNLEETRTVRYFLQLTIPDATSTNRKIDLSTGNVNSVFDLGNTDSAPLNISGISTSNPNVLKFRTTSFSIAPQETALVAVLPNVIPFISVQNPDLEIRGYVELRQTRQFILNPNTTPEARVLVTPENRGTFLDDDYPSMSETLDFDQLAYSLPTANGKSEGVVEEVPPLDIDVKIPNLDLPVFIDKVQSIDPTILKIEIEEQIRPMINFRDAGYLTNK
jgi:hypothetical protein